MHVYLYFLLPYKAEKSMGSQQTLMTQHHQLVCEFC